MGLTSKGRVAAFPTWRTPASDRISVVWQEAQTRTGRAADRNTTSAPQWGQLTFSTGRSPDAAQQFRFLGVELFLTYRADGEELVELFDLRERVVSLTATPLTPTALAPGKARRHGLADGDAGGRAGAEAGDAAGLRSEARRGGKEWCRTGRTR